MEMKGQLKERTWRQSTDHSDNEKNEKSISLGTFCSSQRAVWSAPQYKGFLFMGSYVTLFKLPEDMKGLQ